MNLMELYVSISVDTKDFKNDAKEAVDAAEEIGEGADKSGGKVDKLGTLTVAAGQLIANAFSQMLSACKNYVSYAVSATMDYESAFAKVTTIMDDTQMSTGDMNDSIIALSNQMGVSASDISNSVYDVISATGDTANAVDLVETSTKLARAGFAETSDAVSVLSTAINAYGLEMSDAEQISDSLITVQNLGVTTVGDLSTQMGRAIATGAAYSINLSNVETVYIALTKAGIQTAEATTYMSSMFNELGDSGSEVSGILQEQTGKSFGQLMNDGYSLADVLRILIESCDGDTEAMMNLWGSAEAGKAAASIASQGLEQFNDWLGQVEDSSGTTQTAFETMSDTAAVKIDVLKTNLTNTAAEAIQPIIDQVMEALPTIQEILSGVITTLGNMAAFLIEHRTIIAAIAVGIGALITVLGVMNGITTIATTIQAAKVAMNLSETASLAELAVAEIAVSEGLLLIVGIIAAVIAIGVLLITHWDTVKEKAAQLGQAVYEKFLAIQNTATSVVTNIKNFFVNGFTEAKNKVLGVFDSIRDGIRDKINAARDFVSGAIEKIKGFFHFDWSLPSIKLPHFGISGKFSLNPLSVPHLTVDWYKKAMDGGLMFDEPTVLATSSGLKGFGDAGAEIVIGRDSLMGMISDTTSADMRMLAASIDKCYALMAEFFPEMAADKGVVLDDGTLAGKLTSGVNKRMQRAQLMEARGVV